jgi:rhodanese-related sulfurtransferase
VSLTIARVSPHEAAAKLAEGWVYIDVRPDDEFAEGHPLGALNVPYTRHEARFVEAVRAAVGADAKLVLGCKSGLVSLYAAEMLAQGGYEVVEQRAGFDGVRGTFGELKEPGWARLGLPIAAEDDS